MNSCTGSQGREDAQVWGVLPEAARAMQVQQGLVLALAHCLSISSNADLQQQMIDEILKDLAPACHHLQSLHQSKGAALTASFYHFSHHSITELPAQSFRCAYPPGRGEWTCLSHFNYAVCLHTQHQAWALHEQRRMERCCRGRAQQRALLHQAGTYHGQGGALGEHTAPLGEPSGCHLLKMTLTLGLQEPAIT